MQELKELIESSKNILITSHISPDPDAVSSTLLLGRTLKHNYPDKQVEMVLEESPSKDLGFLTDYQEIKFLSLLEFIENFQPDLFIILDGNSFKRVSRVNGNEIKDLLSKISCKTVIIDHHEEADRDTAEIFINNKRPATAEEVYVVCFEQLMLTKPEDSAEVTLLGIVSDTQRHRFDHPGYRETYRIVSDLLDEGASIEKLEVKLEHFTKKQMEVLSELIKNIIDSGEGYTYSYVSDEFKHEYMKVNKTTQYIKDACDEFINRYVRAFEDNQWGFVVYPELVNGVEKYSVSMRSVVGVKDVSEIARKLGGGGHKPAAGAKLQANSVEEALKIVKAAL